MGLFSKVVPILACSRNAVTKTKMKKQVKLKGTNTKLGKDWSEPQILPFFFLHSISTTISVFLQRPIIEKILKITQDGL